MMKSEKTSENEGESVIHQENHSNIGDLPVKRYVKPDGIIKISGKGSSYISDEILLSLKFSENEDGYSVPWSAGNGIVLLYNPDLSYGDLISSIEVTKLKLMALFIASSGRPEKEFSIIKEIKTYMEMGRADLVREVLNVK